MPVRPASDVFDYPSFLAEVKEFCRRQYISDKDLAAYLETDYAYLKSLLGMRHKQHSPSFRMLVIMADLCDLSIDKYRKSNDKEIPWSVQQILIR